MKPIFAVMSLAAAAAAASAAAADPFDLDWRELAPGVHAGPRPVSYDAPVVGTPVIVVGKTGVLIFDPAGFALEGERVAAKVAELTALPVTHMAISHWHGDHSLGIYKILEEYPDAEVIAHEFTARAFVSPIMGETKAPDAETQKAERERVEKTLATGVRSNGDPVTPGMRAYLEKALRHGDLINAELDRTRLAAPTRTITDRLVVDLGGRKVELLHVGPGNTNGDIVLWLPKERILATGDAVVSPTPYGFFSHPARWSKSLQAMRALDPRTIVPGHGEIMTDAAYVDALIDLMNFIVARVGALVAEGKTLEETRAAIDWSEFDARIARNDPMLAVFFDGWFKTPIVEAAYKEAKGEDSEPLDYSGGGGG